MNKILSYILMLSFSLLLIGCGVTKNNTSDKAISPQLDHSMITGISNGGIYPHGVTINIIAEDITTYDAKINDITYNFNTLFDEEGTHTLNILATNIISNLTSNLTATFSIDKAYPAYPKISSFIDDYNFYDITQLFYTTVNFTVIDPVENVTYTAIINNSDYILGTPFCEQGDHIITVNAIKNNTLTRSRRRKFRIDTIPPEPLLSFSYENGNFDWEHEDLLIKVHILYSTSNYLTFSPSDNANTAYLSPDMIDITLNSNTTYYITTVVEDFGNRYSSPSYHLIET